MRRLASSLFIIAVLILPLCASASDDFRKIAVTGKSEVVLDAHYAILKLEIKNVDEDLRKSHLELNESISNLTNSLTAVGLDTKDLKKSLILQGEEFTYKNYEQVHKGYYSLCIVELRVPKIECLEDVYKILADFKNIKIQYTDFKRNDEFEIREKEYEKALLAAKKKGEFMAHVLNSKLGRVHSIQEQSYGRDYFRIQPSPVGAGVGNTPPMSQTGFGSIQIGADVTVEFELE